MAGKLAPSLKRIFTELDTRWPKRDRRTDGWYASPQDRITKGHNPGHNGYSHAIDVDKDGINPMWVIANLTRTSGVLWYIIWNRHLYSATYGWAEKPYTGKNPHTDHMHIEIRQTDYAENWLGWWGIAPGPHQPAPPPPPSPGGYDGGSFSGDFGADYGGRDYRQYVVNLSESFTVAGNSADGYGKRIRALRR